MRRELRRKRKLKLGVAQPKPLDGTWMMLPASLHMLMR